jgi:hypothetical protein
MKSFFKGDFSAKKIDLFCCLLALNVINEKTEQPLMENNVPLKKAELKNLKKQHGNKNIRALTIELMRPFELYLSGSKHSFKHDIKRTKNYLKRFRAYYKYF